MAKHNVVMLYGQVVQKPRIFKNDQGEYFRGMCPLNVLRGVRDTGYVDKLQYDCPVVMTSNLDLIREMDSWEQYDMVEIKGTIATKEVRKSTPCPHCGHKNIANGNVVYVNPIYMGRREHNITREEGLGLLKKRVEISNQVMVVGTLCRDPEEYQTAKGQSIVQYQLADNRKFHVKEDAPDIRTDYPWVKVYGKNALSDLQSLHTGSVVLVDGMLQHRNIERTSICSECGTEYKWNDSALEIVPYSVEYLQNFVTQTELDEQASKEAESLANQILSS